MTATNGPIFPGLASENLFNQTSRFGVNITVTGNVTSIPTGFFPNIFPNISIPPYFLTALIVLLLGIVSASIILNLKLQSSSIVSSFDEETDLEKQRESVADILDSAIDGLRQGGEYRKTVLQCYRKICEILEQKSKISGELLTAREFESAVSVKLKMYSPYLSQMTDIFEVARYSDREVTKAEADSAIVCLSNLSSLLRTPGKSS